MSYRIITGDCLADMPKLLADGVQVDSVVTDPPYLIEFMNREFDRQHSRFPGRNVGQKMQAWHAEWANVVIELMKPGAFIVALGGERTFHRLYSALEDAGFEPRTTVLWLHAQGFPKNRNVTRDLQDMEWCTCDD